MSNVGSISDQSLGGIITTATHGSGTSFPVISSGVISLSLLKADGSVVECSRENNKELFLATLCGLGTTGLILRVRLQVEKAFRLRETVEPLTFDQFVDEGAFKDIGSSSEHTRAWWFPQVDSVSVARANRTYDVSTSLSEQNILHPRRLTLMRCSHDLSRHRTLLQPGAITSGTSASASTSSSSCSSSRATSRPSRRPSAGLYGTTLTASDGPTRMTATRSLTLTAWCVSLLSVPVRFCFSQKLTGVDLRLL